MAKINYEFYSGKDIYDDGTVEDDLLKFYRDNKKIDFDKPEVFYLTTELRENILNWYPFTKNDSILEIGCGAGTITGMFCKKVKKVVAVESSKRRSEICLYRHNKYDNLDIYACDLKNFKTKEKFDYIVMIGVFEYSKIFSDTDKPFEYFINNLKALLNPNGKILIAIENRYGIKYWAGNNEDHLGIPFVGLYGYEYARVQTFGKEELIRIFNDCKINKYKFYYVFPDYKIPSIIYTDDHFPTKADCVDLPIFNQGIENYNFDPRKIMPGIIDNKQFDFFSNSFLIELGIEKEAKLSNISFVKNQLYRNKNYKIVTYLKDKNYYKKALYESGNAHLEDIYINHKKIKELNIKICDVQKVKDELKFEIIEGYTLSEKIYELVSLSNKSEIEKVFDNFYKYLKSISNKKSKKYILKYGLLDLHMDNIIVTKKNDYVLIDQEWCTNAEIPIEYPLLVSISEIYRKNRELESIIPEKEMLKKYNIDIDLKKELEKIGVEFFDKEKNFKDKTLNQYLMKRSTINLDFNLNNLISEFEKEIDTYKEKITALGQKNLIIKKELENIKVENSQLKTEREKILNSKRYKFISNLADIKNKLKDSRCNK